MGTSFMETMAIIHLDIRLSIFRFFEVLQIWDSKWYIPYLREHSNGSRCTYLRLFCMLMVFKLDYFLFKQKIGFNLILWIIRNHYLKRRQFYNVIIFVITTSAWPTSKYVVRSQTMFNINNFTMSCDSNIVIALLFLPTRTCLNKT